MCFFYYYYFFFFIAVVNFRIFFIWHQTKVDCFPFTLCLIIVFCLPHEPRVRWLTIILSHVILFTFRRLWSLRHPPTSHFYLFFRKVPFNFSLLGGLLVFQKIKFDAHYSALPSVSVIHCNNPFVYDGNAFVIDYLDFSLILSLFQKKKTPLVSFGLFL